MLPNINSVAAAWRSSMRLAVQGDVIGIDLGQLRRGGEVGYGYSPPTLESWVPSQDGSTDTWWMPGSTDIRNIFVGGVLGNPECFKPLYMTLAYLGEGVDPTYT